MRTKLKIISILIISLLLINVTTFAVTDGIPIPTIDVDVRPAETTEDTVNTIQIIILLTVLSLAPSILIMTTCFTRIIIILSFLRNALGTQQMPPNQILIGLALFLTLFIMTPTFTRINEEAFAPFTSNQITQDEAFEKAKAPIKEFMLKQIRGEDDLALFIRLSGIEAPATAEELPLTVIIPAFILNELKVAFQIGFIIYILLSIFSILI